MAGGVPHDLQAQDLYKKHLKNYELMQLWKLHGLLNAMLYYGTVEENGHDYWL